ncbi:unnamed protein product [Calicophoron daubneyi]|uniref:Cyclin-dependent kinase 20 n=1 Tax=Calicophoron daubneyi TaxID=300641 RepID=A0AAV2T2L7_CALDB
MFPHGTGFVLVFDYMHTDLSEVIRNSGSPLTDSQIKSYMVMILSGVEVMHRNGIMHRELKDLPDYNKITFNLCEPTPFEEIFPDASSEAVDLIKQFLVYPPYGRISVGKALLHDYFTTEPLPAHSSELPHPNPHRTGFAAMVHPQQAYESCLTASMGSLLVGHDLLREGALLSVFADGKRQSASPVPCASPTQIAVPLSNTDK